MSAEQLFGELLGLGLSWRVTECVFSRSEGRVELQVENTQESWKSEWCPRCGSVWKGYDHTEEVRWDHLHVMQYLCQITLQTAVGMLAEGLKMVSWWGMSGFPVVGGAHPGGEAKWRRPVGPQAPTPQ